MDILNKATKIGIFSAVLCFSLFREGSPSTIINNSQQEVVSNDNEKYYDSNDTFFTTINSPQSIVQTIEKVTVTAYSSTPDQTDDSHYCFWRVGL